MSSIAQRDTSLKAWPDVRSAYIQREERPTFEDLEVEFRVPKSSISRLATEEGWALQRARHLDAQLVRADVSSALLELARDKRETSTAIANSALVGVRKISFFVEQIPDDTKPKAALDLLNTASFATANFAKALKDAGLVDIPKALSDQLGKGDNSKDFLKGALQQINITVQNATQPAQAVQIAEADLTDLPP